jgi:hypothetical protein
MKNSVASLALCRFFQILPLGIWIGGLAFFGAVVAPVIAKRLGLLYELVAPFLGRFGTVTLALGVLMLLGWALERNVSTHIGGKKLWAVQGACMAAMLGIALFLHFALMPPITKLQPVIYQQQKAAGRLELSAREARGQLQTPEFTEFDRLHHIYNTGARLCLFLGLASLAIFCWRVSLKPENYSK